MDQFACKVLYRKNSKILHESYFSLFNLLYDGQRLQPEARFPQTISASLKALFNHRSNSRDFRARLRHSASGQT